ncbi:hypothetical protein JBE38_15765 [Pseudomonas sp. ICBG1301]|uniref:hypothetical protein n=1 Tax=Pseudomonas sp. ICBG1301 TaxID=2795987 RepID=UPI0019647F16|nr:hypothetical protein [Pseudomonas sp. ICBG1301]MBM9487389.1 hypothetical protein [Pseudomonas sp. ICBG1301]
MLAKNVNDNAGCLNERGACEFFASKLAPAKNLKQRLKNASASKAIQIAWASRFVSAPAEIDGGARLGRRLGFYGWGPVRRDTAIRMQGGIAGRNAEKQIDHGDLRWWERVERVDAHPTYRALGDWAINVSRQKMTERGDGAAPLRRGGVYTHPSIMDIRDTGRWHPLISKDF